MKGESGGFELDTDIERIDFPAVTRWLAGTYWSPGISQEQVERTARYSSLVIGAYLPNAGNQAGFLRVVSDRVRFAWICDVFVAEPFRGRGLARAMVRHALDHPEHQGLSRWLLATRDAHEVYRGVGFSPLDHVEAWMTLRPRGDAPQPTPDPLA